jgi:hypothetical protein
VSAPPSEATRLAELDARIRRDCQRSGVPFHVEDDALLDRIAGLLTGTSGDDGQPATTPASRLSVREQEAAQA